MESFFAEFENTLERARELFLQENSLLKKGSVAEHTELLEKKKALLTSLEEGIANLKNLKNTATDTQSKTQIRALQDKIMQLLMLDRENEQLLLKQSVGAFRVTAAPRASAATLEKMYKKL